MDKAILIITKEEETEYLIENAWKVLNDMRLKGIMCDGILSTESGVFFPIHRFVMVTCSPYFKALFTTHLGSGIPQCCGDAGRFERTCIIIPGVTPNILASLIEYAYTFQTSVNEINVKELLVAADQFAVENLLAECCEFLKKRLTIENCISTWLIAKYYYCDKLNDFTFKYILENFQSVATRSTELIKIPREIFVEILKSDRLMVSSEYIIWYCIIRWIMYDYNSRNHFILDLMQYIRLGLISPSEFIHNIARVKTTNPAIQNIVNKVVSAIQYVTSLNTSTSFLTKLSVARFPTSLIFAIGGWNDLMPTTAVEIYDKMLDCWIEIPHKIPLKKRAYHQIHVVDDKIYIIGGTNGLESLKSCEAFDLKKKKWKIMADMTWNRCYLCSVYFDGYIYAMGGFDGLSRLNAAEKYNIHDNKWINIMDMKCERSDAAASVLMNSIIVCGGFNGSHYLNTVEIYNPRTNFWTLVAPMISKRSGLSCISYEAHYCLALGGFSGIQRLSTVELYDAVNNIWICKPSMLVERSNFAVVEMDGQIYVCGGYDGINTCNSVEKCDLRKMIWSFVAQLNIHRSALSCCVVNDFEIISDFATDQRIINKKKYKTIKFVNDFPVQNPVLKKHKNMRSY